MAGEGKLWLLWSNYHGAWHRDGASGYTTNIANAGLFGEAVARRYHDNPEKIDGNPRDEMIDPADIRAKRVIKRDLLNAQDRIKRLEHLAEAAGLTGAADQSNGK